MPDAILGTGKRQRSPTGWAILAVGAIAIVVAAVTFVPVAGRMGLLFLLMMFGAV